MANVIPSPDPQSLLPPLLACLPTSFASSKPPPALLELLSPILRQRLTYLTSGESAHDNWLRLLCWDSSKAEQLKETIENASFEPHPSSGELEVGEIERLSYKRSDAETLKAQIPLNDWDLTALYMWCTSSEEGNAWKLFELIPYDSGLCQDQSWSSTPAQAVQTSSLRAQMAQTQTSGRKSSVPGQGQDDDDDDYWAQYDRTPNDGTPARKGSVNPAGAGSGSTEADYYAQYAGVQPAMDNYDPDEQHKELGESTLGRDSMPGSSRSNLRFQQNADEEPTQQPQELNRLHIPEDEDVVHIDQPVPSSPSSRAGSDTISRLESKADRYSASEIAIKQHISYSVKSMYRLAKGAGMSRQEFEDMVQRELETLSMLDRED